MKTHSTCLIKCTTDVLAWTSLIADSSLHPFIVSPWIFRLSLFVLESSSFTDKLWELPVEHPLLLEVNFLILFNPNHDSWLLVNWLSCAGELRQMIRQEMENNRNCNDKQRIRYLISEGLEKLKRLDEMLDMQGH